MRNKARIPIVMDLMLNTSALSHFLQPCDRNVFLDVHSRIRDIEKEWLRSPDMRFGQLLCVLRLIPSIEVENRIWRVEETEWLRQNEYCRFDEINFWGVNYFKNNKPRKTTKYKLLKDLKTDHIENIIKFFEDNNTISRIPANYLNYFNTRIEQNG